MLRSPLLLHESSLSLTCVAVCRAIRVLRSQSSPTTGAGFIQRQIPPHSPSHVTTSSDTADIFENLHNYDEELCLSSGDCTLSINKCEQMCVASSAYIVCVGVFTFRDVHCYIASERFSSTLYWTICFLFELKY